MKITIHIKLTLDLLEIESAEEEKKPTVTPTMQNCHRKETRATPPPIRPDPSTQGSCIHGW
jgi:hypothetical protein